MIGAKTKQQNFLCCVPFILRLAEDIVQAGIFRKGDFHLIFAGNLELSFLCD